MLSSWLCLWVLVAEGCALLPRPPVCLAEMYSLLLESYIKDPAEKDRLFHAISTVDCVKKKADWAIKWINRWAWLCSWHRGANFRNVVMLCMPGVVQLHSACKVPVCRLLTVPCPRQQGSSLEPA